MATRSRFKSYVYVIGIIISLEWWLRYSTMGCQHVCGDNTRALASGLSYVQIDKHGITILYHLH